MVNLARYGQIATTGEPLRIAGWQDAEVLVRYRCIDYKTGIFRSEGFAPQIEVIATPGYPSLFGSMGGFTDTLTLYARQQAVVVGV